MRVATDNGNVDSTAFILRLIDIIFVLNWGYVLFHVCRLLIPLSLRIFNIHGFNYGQKQEIYLTIKCREQRLVFNTVKIVGDYISRNECVVHVGCIFRIELLVYNHTTTPLGVDDLGLNARQ